MAKVVSIKVAGAQVWDPDDENLDVEVMLDDGRRLGASFFTIRNIQSLFKKNRTTGECANGLYLWSTDMIVVEQLTMTVIEKTVHDLLEEGYLDQAFQVFSDDPDPDSGESIAQLGEPASLPAGSFDEV